MITEGFRCYTHIFSYSDYIFFMQGKVNLTLVSSIIVNVSILPSNNLLVRGEACKKTDRFTRALSQ